MKNAFLIVSLIASTTPALADIINQSLAERVAINIGDGNRISCFSYDDNGDKIPDRSVATITASYFTRTPAILEGHYLQAQESGTQLCQRLIRMKQSAPKCFMHLSGPGSSIVTLEGNSLKETLQITLHSCAAKIDDSITFSSSVEKTLTPPN